ncbi:hypothetical protein YC2023_095261 [Brassica napus]
MKGVLSLISIFLVLVLSGRCSDVYSRNDFPKGFSFGSATSAYQVPWEGAAGEDGKKPSVWDTFLHSRNLDNGDIACDGYHKYKEDVQLMVETGLEAFRFSISSEIYLEDEYGGWINSRIIQDFTAYADVCFREFGNHVKFWTTINEANIFTIGGYNDGVTPPGRCSSSPGRNCSSGNSSTEPYIVGHNLLLAHASASRLYKQQYKEMQGGCVGFSIFTIGFTPSTSSKDDEIAVQRAKDLFFGWMLGPLIFGDYPDEMKRTVGSRLPVFSLEESEQYAVAPWAMEGVLEYIKQSYGNPPVYILENGRPLKQDLQLQQKDTPRIDYLHAYIGAVLKSIRNGSDTRGYFVWSFMDLYELLRGYEFSFGLYSVNFSDPYRNRSPKLSAYWYTSFLKGNTTFLGSQATMRLQSNFSSSVSS